MFKITVIGDIMCEPLMLKAAQKAEGYDFSGVFKYVKSMFLESDCVVGNLETPLAGKDVDYVHGLFSFNAPDEFAVAVKEAGISLVTTANNHCVDRGFPGLLRTLDVLDNIGLDHIGTWRKMSDRKEAYYIVKDGQTAAIVTSCYGTNYLTNHCLLTKEEECHINLLHGHTEPVYGQRNKKKSLLKRCLQLPLRVLSIEQQAWLKRKLHLTYNRPREDAYLNETSARPYITQMQSDIQAAKENADVVIFFPHIGGQFNIKPGKFTEYVFEKATEAGCDCIVASHPHIVQKAECIKGIPCFYSIGNFSMSPNSVYLLHENLPDYGLAVHYYLSRGNLERITYSILKIIEDKKKILTVVPVDQYEDMIESTEKMEKFHKDLKQIHKTVTGQESDVIIKKEYIFWINEENQFED